MKKQSVNNVFLNSLLFALLLLSYSKSISARPFAQNQGEMVVKADGITHISTFKGVKQDLVNPMGSEECSENDEECLKRRMTAEAHLDYIYTQHHKP
ncbi:putative phytosulfokines 6 [Citrus sinensis]|uniref:Phytosulfokines 6 n=3 Tax=Citrus TaxID=2706 RepID=A0ACB8K047_CITSI|nr:putative phytosulfokines 6 [Citrus x clementina]XP_006481888.1 putative phytosulfokines 6 [Citrus sinensis]GAY33266.1 hypothetical protein CUMW_006430 [Citrus unshiu]ESR43534.1 hypothetical protein CICLE_v10013197mg [Citrus x clementina]KAH9674806.1 putative phytosulfokines 6 [Citrus sinensis]KAH9738406.1 putative phytosulfokines 6 [Citrus sinensis]KDO61037.1 hypothetical protein CISIN_1g034398mg [Citrus sinensis]